MIRTGVAVTMLLLLGVLFIPCSQAAAATDGLYTLSEVSATWDATHANRYKAPIPAPTGSSYQYDYDHTYGDEATITYTLPWPFNFYGQTYTQITADTNGNIWFTATGSAHSFSLANTGRGPVIAAWNNDLSSYYYGGVFIQHKNDSNSDRVVIEWQTETYSDSGNYRPSNFEVVLFSNGRIWFNYRSFDASAGKDFGSGISKGDGANYLNFTANYGNAFNLQGTSYQFQMLQISVDFAGTGRGTVTSVPAGIACSSGCSAQFQPGGQVTLTVAPDANSSFAGWAGACTGTALCQITMNDNKTVTATFNILPPVAEFSASPASGGTPLIATFTDTSQRATSWLWNFGDGTTSTERNPSHVYKTPGTYTIALTVANESGSATAPPQTITVTACQNQPVRIQNTNVYYPSLAAALLAVADGQTIQLQDWNFAEGATISKSVTLDGGYDCGFANKTGRSVLEGELHINGGSVRMKDVRIAGAALSAVPAVIVAPSADSFGSVLVNSASGAHSFTIGNSGGANLTIGDITLSGANPGEFVKTADACSGKALTLGTNCVVQVEFAPLATGARSAVLAIPSNDPATPTAGTTLNGIGIYPAITVSKAGTGSGTVTSPAGISCGSACSGSFAPGTVTLSASADANSLFAGWSGGGCSGTGDCTLTQNADTQVTAIFNLQPASADFSVTPQTGADPLLVTFTNLSQNATSWFWDFGDGTTGTEPNPTHLYRTPGTYTVNLSASNVGGSAPAPPKTITVNACQTLPVRIKETSAYYPSLSAALSVVTDNQTIQLQDRTFAGDVTIGNTITLDGGYDCGYSTVKTGKTVLQGGYHINGGTVTMKDVHVSK